jgi:hypothetical protein
MGSYRVNPTKLPQAGDIPLDYSTYLEGTPGYFDRQHKEGTLDIPSCADLIGIYMRVYQMWFQPSQDNQQFVLFPNLFLRPTEGATIRNLTQGITYTVDQVVVDPDTGIWDGILKLDLGSSNKAPSNLTRDVLLMDDPDNLIGFYHVFPPQMVGKENDSNTQSIVASMKPCITWGVERKEPAGLSKSFESRKNLKPRKRETIRDPLTAGQLITVYGQEMDSLVNFECWASNQVTVEHLVEWFESFLKQHVRLLRQKGLVESYFYRRTRNSDAATWRQNIPIRTSQWFFRTEELWFEREKAIVYINTYLDTARTITRSEPKQVAGQTLKSGWTHDDYRSLFYRDGVYLFGERTLSE